MSEPASVRLVVHADESCLGNGMEGPNPGGAASLVEIVSDRHITRLDLYISAPDTTNNRMALSGAIATFALVSQQYPRASMAFVSDSQYLVKGITEWVSSWRARGWRRKGGPIENLELWKQLVRESDRHDATWIWVRGHAGHVKNEYANDLAIRAASEQATSDGLVESGFEQWLAGKRSRGLFMDFDPTEHAAELDTELGTPR